MEDFVLYDSSLSVNYEMAYVKATFHIFPSDCLNQPARSHGFDWRNTGP